MVGIALYIDTTPVQALLDDMASKLTPGQFDALMRRTLNETAKHTRAVTVREVRKDYVAPTDWVRGAIKAAKITGGGAALTCTIPVVGPKGKIGGIFSAAGGAYGWNPPPYRITSQIVKGQTSTMPSVMSSYGGQPPFRNIGVIARGKSGRKLKRPKDAPTKGGSGALTWTRTGKDRFPIEPVAGLAVPQMVMTRARPEIEDETLRYLEARAVHHFSRIFG